jgi:hypothetical protein
MKLIGKTVFLAVAMALSLWGGGIMLSYNFKPGQTWHCLQSNQSVSTYMGQKNVNQGKTLIEYRVSKGPKSGWVTLTAKIKSHSNPNSSGSTMQFEKMTFTADVHRSGEIRNIKTSGNPFPEMDEISPEMQAMYQQSVAMVADAWKHTVFWFPEVPEEKLEIGDEFEVERDMGMGSSASMMQTRSLSRQVYTLEDVSEGLAYFSVKERSVTKSETPMGGSSETKIAGKGEVVFDLGLGMWLDLTEKSKARVDIGMGMGTQEMSLVHKFEMELQ